MFSQLTAYCIKAPKHIIAKQLTLLNDGCPVDTTSSVLGGSVQAVRVIIYTNVYVYTLHSYVWDAILLFLHEGVWCFPKVETAADYKRKQIKFPIWSYNASVEFADVLESHITALGLLSYIPLQHGYTIWFYAMQYRGV